MESNESFMQDARCGKNTSFICMGADPAEVARGLQDNVG